MGRRLPPADAPRSVLLALIHFDPPARVPPLAWAAAALLAAALIVHGPALDRLFVEDQMVYFAELEGDTSLAAGLAHYDYAASRRFERGDDLLFRPLLFVRLAVANRLLSYHHVWWNLLSLALHVLVGLTLFRLLVAIQPSAFALPAAVLFVVLKPPLELVLWNHLGGYLLAGACLAIGLRAFVRLTAAPDGPASGGAATFTAAFLVAGLLYEVTMLIGALASAVLLWLVKRRGRRPTLRRALVLFLPALVFSALYLGHLLRVDRLSYVDGQPASGVFTAGNLLDLLPHSLAVLRVWLLEVALPSALTFSPHAFHRLHKSFAFSWDTPLHLVNLALALAVLALMAVSISRRHLVRVGPLLAVLTGGILAYVAVLNFGRAYTDVLVVTYYLYLFCLMLVPFAYTLVDFDRVRGGRRVLMAVVVAALIVVHGVEARAAAREMGRVSADPSRYLTRIARCVDAHRDDPGFSFAIVNVPEWLDPAIGLREGYPDEPNVPIRVRRYSQILFARYYDEDRPRYLVDGRQARAPTPFSPWRGRCEVLREAVSLAVPGRR